MLVMYQRCTRAVEGEREQGDERGKEEKERRLFLFFNPNGTTLANGTTVVSFVANVYPASHAGGTVAFFSEGLPIPGCQTVNFISDVALCQASFLTIGTYTISINWNSPIDGLITTSETSFLGQLVPQYSPTIDKSVFYTVSLNYDLNNLPGGSVAAFSASFADSLASVLGISPDLIQVLSVTAGSVNVAFYVHQAAAEQVLLDLSQSTISPLYTTGVLDALIPGSLVAAVTDVLSLPVVVEVFGILVPPRTTVSTLGGL